MSAETRYNLASKLAQFLRRNGDKVISGSCKLSLTTSALCLLNTLFAEVLNREWNNPIDLSNSESAVSTIQEDVQFLYHFMKRTSSLKLFHGAQTLRGGVDLSHFSNVEVLELRKLPAHLIIGLDCLSVQLKVLICSRSIYLLKEIFDVPSEPSKELHIWPELKELNLSYNYLECLDQSLRSLPNVEVIDLSHNHIKNADNIDVLEKLFFVNLSYNELDHFPAFHLESCRTLTKLYIRNNNLENLDGLDCFFNIEELDVGYNLLSEYSVLSPLDRLKCLKQLNLEGNPIFYHNRHTALVRRFINSSALEQGFRLNGKLLPVPEIQISNLQNVFNVNGSNHQTAINAVVGNVDNTMRIPERGKHPPNSSPEIQDQDSCEGNSVSSLTSQSGAEFENAMKGARSKSKSKKKKKSSAKIRKMREALIAQKADGEYDEKLLRKDNADSLPSHMKTKQLIESRREERGESWLIPDPYHLQKPSTETPKVPFNTPVFTVEIQSPRASNVHESGSSIFKDDSPSMQTPSSSVEKDHTFHSPKEMSPILDIVPQLPEEHRDRHHSRDSDDIHIITSSCQPGIPTDCLLKSTSREDFAEYDIYHNAVPSEEIENEELDSEEENEDSIFFVEKVDGGKKQPVSISLGPNYMKEKDVQSGKTIEKLDLNCLISISCVSKDAGDVIQQEVFLEFDTFKTSKQKRHYLFENTQVSQILCKRLQPFADAKTLREAVEGALECLKCNSQFSKQGAHKKVILTKKPQGALSSSYDSNKEYPQEVDTCPNCGNHILVEMESFPMPARPSPARPVKLPARKSSGNMTPDSASAGSPSSGKFASFFSSMKISPILQRKSVSSQQDTENSKQSQADPPTTSTPQGKEKKEGAAMSRNSSSVTITSNQSQSSIAVIPDYESEMNLNTIVERDSHSSMSPPISQDSNYHNVYNTPKSEDFLTGNPSLKPPANASQSNTHNYNPSSGSEDFCSPRTSQKSENSDNNPDQRCLDEASRLLNVLGEKQVISHEQFSELDHRLKLHLEINVFSKDEQLEACLETSIVPLSTGMEFDGLFALSSKKIYVIKFLQSYNMNLSQGDAIAKSIQVVFSGASSQLQQVKVLLGSQGLTVAMGSQVFSLIVRDADICNSFSSLLSDLSQEGKLGKIDFLSSEDILNILKDSVFSSNVEADPMPEILLHLFAFWNPSSDKESDPSQPVCIIVTPEDVYVSKILFKKQDSCTNISSLSIYHYTEIGHQKISDLISLRVKQDLQSVVISFMNESSGLESCDTTYWTLKMQSKSSLHSFVNALKTPWEDIFGVPIPLASEGQL